MGNFFAALNRRHKYRVAAAYAVVAWVLLQLVNNVPPAHGVESPRRIFLLAGLTAAETTSEQTIEAITQRFKERSSEDIEIYSEFLDLGRFGGPANENRLVQSLGAKFAQAKPDIIIPISLSAVDFVVRHRGELARDIPIVYCCTPTSITDTLDIPSDIPGVRMNLDWTSTLALAQRLQPSAKTLVIISGASNLDRRRHEDAIPELQTLSEKYDLKDLAGLPYDELLKEVARLPRNSIVYLTRYFVDGSGRTRGPEVASDLANASTSPVYSPFAYYFGTGIIGGRMENFAGQGAKVADLALDVLSGKTPPHLTALPLQYRVDERQLARWGLDETSLPPGTSIEFRQPTLWEQHQKTIILVLLAFAVLVGFITLLLIEIRKRQQAEEARRTAEAETELRRKEVTHLMRVGIVSELSGGIAHELGQPLAAILANAQAARRLVATNGHDKDEIVEILDDIVEEDSRAAEVIHGLRRLLRKREREVAQINLNDEVTSTLRLVHSELVSRKIKVRTYLNDNMAFVSSDRVQLQQVFLNLIMNAMDAMASTPPSERMLTIGTRSTQNGSVEVSITDNGPGISPDHLKRVFEPYFTTKEHGLGLGLPICSTIVSSHHGQLTVSNANGGGVAAVVSLPVAIRLAAAS